jgi:hypothetical protein
VELPPRPRKVLQGEVMLVFGYMILASFCFAVFGAGLRVGRPETGQKGKKNENNDT